MVKHKTRKATLVHGFCTLKRTYVSSTGSCQFSRSRYRTVDVRRIDKIVPYKVHNGSTDQAKVPGLWTSSCCRCTGELGPRGREISRAWFAHPVAPLLLLHASSPLLQETAFIRLTTAIGESFFRQLCGAQLMLYSRVTHRLKCLFVLCGRLSEARSAGLSHTHGWVHEIPPSPVNASQQHCSQRYRRYM